MAQQMSPGESIIGRQIRSVYDENLLRTVIGVMEDIQFRGIAGENRTPFVLVPRSQSPRRQLAVIVRSSGDPAAVIPEIRRLMAGVDADIALDELQLLRDAHAAGLAPVRFLSGAFTRFGLLALVLALSGVYGLMSYSVSRRGREIGIRVALGASTRSVRAGVLREALTLAAIGCGLGAIVAYGFSQLLARLFPGVVQIELVIVVGAALMLALAVLAASWLPARRATRIDPIAALRSE